MNKKIIIEPAAITMVATSGTQIMLNPLASNSFLMFLMQTVLPAQGPLIKIII